MASIVNCHSFTNVPGCEEYIECILVFVIRVPEFQIANSDHLGKRKIRYATIVAIFWDQICPKKWMANEKINIKTVITYNTIFLCQITVYLENSRLREQIWPKERMINIYIYIFYLHKNIKSIKNIKIKILRHYQHNTSNSCSKFHLIWRIINSGSKLAQKLL